MNQSSSALELKTATKRLMRWRIPLFLALTANVGVLARMAFAPGGVAAAPPSTAVASAATHDPAEDHSANSPTAQVDNPPTPRAVVTSELTHHSPVVPEAGPHANRTDGAMTACLAPPPSEIARTNDTAATTNASIASEQPASHDPAELVPTLSALAANWWPTIESAAEGASQLVAAQQPTTGTLTIGNVQQNGVPVSFLVDGRVYTLHPGESHKFPIGTSWDLQFHRGGAFGLARQPLSPGEYQFVVSANGWELQPSP